MGIIILSALLYIVGSGFVSAPEGAGANIGAGLLVLLVGAVFLVGAAVTVAGVIRQLVLRRRGSAQRDAS